MEKDTEDKQAEEPIQNLENSQAQDKYEKLPLIGKSLRRTASTGIQTVSKNLNLKLIKKKSITLKSIRMKPLPLQSFNKYLYNTSLAFKDKYSYFFIMSAVGCCLIEKGETLYLNKDQKSSKNRKTEF